MELLVSVLACFGAAAAAPGLFRVVRHRVGPLLAVVPAAVAVYLATQAPAVSSGDVVAGSLGWLPSLGIALSFRLDGLALLMGLLITAIGALVSLYAGSYLRGHEHQGRFFLFLYLFMGAMLGLVLADDLIALFVFWELTSISSYFLIGFHTEDARSRRNALQALLVTGAGGLALLAGLVMLGQVAGTTRLSSLDGLGDAVRGHASYGPILALVLAGAFTKSAQFPFHFWLPGAMVAPSPVSAYLHSATMVKAGIYLMARLHPTLGGTTAWTAALVAAGGATLLVGTVQSLRQTDLKLVLAHTTVASLGLLTLLLGLGSEHAVQAAMAFLLAHALYKGALFLVAGSVDHGTGSRDITRLAGLRHVMPATAAASIVAAISFMGLPPLLGFVAKEAVLAAVLEVPGGAGLATWVAVLLVGGVVAAFIAGVRPFLGALRTPDGHPHESPLPMLAGPLVLAGAGMVFGLVPAWADHALVSPAASAALGTTTHAHLALWHGINAPLAVSVLVVASAAALLVARIDLRRILDAGFGSLDVRGPTAVYDAGIRGLLRGAKWQARVLQNGRISVYLAVLVATATALLIATLVGRDGGAVGPARGTPMGLVEVVVIVVMIIAAVAITQVRSRLGAVIILGMVGYAVALLFILYSAPDLAMTQFLFETLTVLLFAYVLWGMPRLVKRSRPSVRVWHAVLCAGFGGVMGWLALIAMTESIHGSISAFYASQSYIAAHGRNVVNVILVDFRGLDTLGEITVLAVAALGVAALLRLRGSEPQ